MKITVGKVNQFVHNEALPKINTTIGTGSGVGQVVALSTAKMPSGGKWAYAMAVTVPNPQDGNPDATTTIPVAGVANGGTFIAGGTDRGSVIMESIFAIPGLGQLFYDAVMSRDYPLVMGGLVIGAVLTLLGNLLADLAYAWVDPRVRDANFHDLK